MLDNIKKYNIILASKSPRRHYLLKELGVEFNIHSGSNDNETYPSKLVNEEIVIYLAEQKANNFVNKLSENDLLITADTIVILKNKVLNKPKDKTGAFAMLKSMSGSKHIVLTGVCIKSLKKTSTFYAKTDVYFKYLSNEEINYYIEKFNPYDKAGAYGIQEWIGYIGIERIDGSYFNVMGLPVQKLYDKLSKF